MKKLISLILALTLVLSMSVSAFATEWTSNDATDGTTNLTGQIGAGTNKDEAYYEVVIPATLDLGNMERTTEGYTSTKVGLQVARLLPDTAIKFTFKDSATTVTMESDDTETDVVCDLVFTGNTTASFQTDNTTDAGCIKVTPHAADVANAKVGSYTGTVSFVIETVNTTAA